MFRAMFARDAAIYGQNADLNGAINISKRFSGYMLENGASLATPMNFPRVK